ncbi:MAG: outer membrane protein assembly factor BamA [Bacteroidales bacterium]|nr:outer membrane protein assembly factor BamA [Bacteroidales bacterium]
MNILKTLLVFVFGAILPFFALAQQDSIKDKNNSIELDYFSPKEYEIGNIIVTGADHLDHPSIILISGLSVGDKIFVPSDKITDAIDKLWKQNIFDDVQILVEKIEGKTLFLNFAFKTKPRMASYKFTGKNIKRSDGDKIREELNIMRGDIVTENMKMNCINIIKDYYFDKGFYNTEVSVEETKDTSTTRNDVNLIFNIERGEKIKIKDVVIKGSNSLKGKWWTFSGTSAESVVRSQMKDTKRYRWWRVWKSSRFQEKDFTEDKKAIIKKYNDEGFRNARILSDSVYLVKNKKGKQSLIVELNIEEGKKFFFRNITWVGNTKYTSEELSKRLRIKNGDPYNRTLLKTNVEYDPTGADISAIYQDDGYLFFQVIPVEVNIQNDSIDIEMRVHEGKQARIGKVSISGNSRTNDHVIMRELKTLPGQLFSRDAVIRSLRELQQLQYFDQENLNYDIQPDQDNGLVDIEYKLKEINSDKFEISGGWGAGMVIGTVGVTFTNFSTKNFFKKDAWRPLPSGDGQHLSLRAQTNGTYYYSLSASFTEPWLGGKKPNALSGSVFYSYQDDGYWNNSGSPSYWLSIFGASLSLGKRLQWPDDYFTFVQGISFQQYNVKNYPAFVTFKTGRSNNLNYNFTVARNSSDSPIFPRTGSDISFTTQLTFPYSLVNGKDYNKLSNEEKYKWLEYYKVNIKSAWYFNLVDNLVMSTRARFGFLGQYNNKVGYSPFERYYVGGDGLQGWALDGREVIALRGYTASSLSPTNGATVFDKFTLDLRYPISLNPVATIYALAFFEAGNSWENFEGFAPFKMYRSAGIGLRLFMPMFGLIGIDWGYGFDQIPGSPTAGGPQFHFSIGQSMD